MNVQDFRVIQYEFFHQKYTDLLTEVIIKKCLQV